MKKITIIDYKCGNILNLVRAIKHLGYEVEMTSEKKKIINSSHVILPGVGAFGNAMKQLENQNLNKVILEYAKLNNPLLGICLGMQILLTEGNEFGRHSGLNLIEGEVIKISNNKIKEIKIPHMGWNELYPNKNEKKWKNKILGNESLGKSFYFAHSYVCSIKKKDYIIAVSDYMGVSIPAVISKNNIYGCQFHPEKSSDVGLSFLKNFCDI